MVGVLYLGIRYVIALSCCYPSICLLCIVIVGKLFVDYVMWQCSNSLSPTLAGGAAHSEGSSYFLRDYVRGQLGSTSIVTNRQINSRQ